MSEAGSGTLIDGPRAPGGATGPPGGTDPWDGPLDLLLTHVRAQRVDLARVSMAALVDRCLAAMTRLPMAARADQIGLAAELTELKSRLLLPRGAEGTDEASDLRRQLERLMLIRQAAQDLTTRNQLGREVFARGMPEMDPPPAARPTLDLMALITAYARLRLQHEAGAPLALRRLVVMTMREALAQLGGRLEELDEWTDLAGLVQAQDNHPRRSIIAASLMAALEMARKGEVEIRQDGDRVSVRRR